MADEETRSSAELDEATLEQQWENVDDDPDLAADLGYELVPLDVLVTSNNDKKLMMLPRCDEMIRDDAYITADFELGCDPLDRA